MKYYTGLCCNRRKSGSKLPPLQKQPHQQPSRDLETSSATKLRNWPHSPAHHLREAGSYIVTAGPYKKVPVSRPPIGSPSSRITSWGLADRYEFSLPSLGGVSKPLPFGGQLATSGIVAKLLRHLHSIYRDRSEQMDGTPGRRVWFEFWETRITFPRSYFAG